VAAARRANHTGGVHRVEIAALPLERFSTLLSPERMQVIQKTAAAARQLLAGRVVWNINSTAQGGGVAEMLHTLLAYGRGAGVDTRWLVLRGTPEFFEVTKRLHNFLHGSAGDGGPLGDAERTSYERVLADNLAACRCDIRAGDIVLLHDPQTAGLLAGLREVGAHLIWRCHIGRDDANQYTDAGWAFLRPYLASAHAFIFSRQSYIPRFLTGENVQVIPPSIDPFTAKNLDLEGEAVLDILTRAGLLTGVGSGRAVTFTRRDGSSGTCRAHDDLIVGQPPPRIGTRLVIQVSRWDRLKDMAGVLRGFATRLPELPADVHLVLAGPDVSGVTDDPEGAQVLAECRAIWRALPDTTRARVYLVSLPMDDVDENAILVNALQRHAHTVVQKSLVEGFGLTVTEAMWKARPVIASAIGGIQDQIADGRDGLLLADPTDLEAFGWVLLRPVCDSALAERLGRAARERVTREFLGDRHLIQYAGLFSALVAGERRG
jgi:trehalose synthase